VFILKLVKVLCFDTLLQVFILKVLNSALISEALRNARDGGQARPPAFIAKFTAHLFDSLGVKSSRWGTRGQLAGGTVEGQVSDF
jgi:hypothetical protein